jgi:hypothetical protein
LPNCGHSAVRYAAHVSANADDLIAEIDAAALNPMTHPVTRGLYRHIPIHDAFENEVLTAFDRGGQPEQMAVFQTVLWEKINSRDPVSQGGLRLLVSLTRPNEPIDWNLAEFMILWARQQGVAEHQIINAFHARPNDG